MAAVPAAVWFDLGYTLLALTFLTLVLRHGRRPLAIVPESWLGKGELLYLGLLWWVVVGNFARILVAFTPERLVTEGVIFCVALACTLIVLMGADGAPFPDDGIRPVRRETAHARFGLAATVALGVAAASLSIVADWAIVRMIYGDRFAGHANLHIRFGPRATIKGPQPR
jgi:hypothetical protein